MKCSRGQSQITSNRSARIRKLYIAIPFTTPLLARYLLPSNSRTPAKLQMKHSRITHKQRQSSSDIKSYNANLEIHAPLVKIATKVESNSWTNSNARLNFRPCRSTLTTENNLKIEISSQVFLKLLNPSSNCQQSRKWLIIANKYKTKMLLIKLYQVRRVANTK